MVGGVGARGNSAQVRRGDPGSPGPVAPNGDDSTQGGHHSSTVVTSTAAAVATIVGAITVEVAIAGAIVMATARAASSAAVARSSSSAMAIMAASNSSVHTNVLGVDAVDVVFAVEVDGAATFGAAQGGDGGGTASLVWGARHGLGRN